MHSEETKLKLSKACKKRFKNKKNHPMYNKKHSEETKRKMSEANTGKKHSEETKRKISESNKGKIFSEKTRKLLSKSLSGENNPMFGKTFSEETKRKWSIKRKDKGNPFYGKSHTEETKQKISITKKEQAKDNINPFYGKSHTEETKLKLSKKAKIRFANPENNPMWRGGISIEPYCQVWADKEYKQSIRDRDNNECQNCEIKQKKLKYLLAIHHIDYDKKNCSPNNLITLCRSCNSIANGNREYWNEFYSEKLICKN